MVTSKQLSSMSKPRDEAYAARPGLLSGLLAPRGFSRGHQPSLTVTPESVKSAVTVCRKDASCALASGNSTFYALSQGCFFVGIVSSVYLGVPKGIRPHRSLLGWQFDFLP